MTISNTRSASLLSRGARLASQNQNATTERELRVSEPCVTETCKVNIRSLTITVRRELKSPRPHKLEARLFVPPPIDLRDYLTKKRSVHQITHYAVVNGSSQRCSLNATTNSRCSNSYHLHQSLAQPKDVIPVQGELFLI